MSLNIKDEAIHKRVQRLARLTGESMTRAVDQAVTERLTRVQKRRSSAAQVERIMKIGRECAALPVLDARSPEDMLYDEHGLPK